MSTSAWDQATRRLARALRGELRGEVRFDDGDRALWAADASNYRQVPIGVVLPADADDVVRTIEIARAHQAPILCRGAGTSLAGQCCNHAVVLDFSAHMHGILELDPERRVARVQPGNMLDRLREAAGEHGLTFGPDPATHDHCTLGGMIGNDSCGIHSVLAEFAGPGPRTSHQVESLEILTWRGERLRVASGPDAVRSAGPGDAVLARQLAAFRDRHAAEIRERIPDIPRRVSGYEIDALLPERGFHVARALAGTEGTCATILEATVTLIPAPTARVLVVLGFESVERAGHAVPLVREHRPDALEGMDHLLVGYMRSRGMHPDDLALLPDGRGWLLVEFGGESAAEADHKAHALMDRLRGRDGITAMQRFTDAREMAAVWAIRESGLGATAFVPGEPDTWPGWEDSAVPPERVGDYLHDLRALLDRHGYACSLYGHFGQGCIHTRIDFDLQTAAGIAKYHTFTREAAELVTGRHGGSLSGEHGDGQARADLLPIMYGEALVGAFAEFKSLWDPDGMMNPGKVVAPAGRTDHLRLGTDYRPDSPATHFAWPDDQGSFARAALRCVGVGKCRRESGGTMCPSYQVLHDEEHTTRGRAHLLFEMLRGETITDGWQSEAVHEALDLCLACKGCKGDCPVDVDMASYKAEFLAHYHEQHRRPRSAWAFGLIDRWARLAGRMSGLVNALAGAPLTGRLMRLVAGIAPEREIPRFAATPFRRQFTESDRPGRRVILWPDTFNNAFHPETLRAAVRVLEAAGCHPVLPPAPLCCGRPLYDFGMLVRARRHLERILDVLGDEIARGTPVVVLEPSCFAVFRDELRNLLPHDANARRLHQQAFSLAEFLTREVTDYAPPTTAGHVLVHAHCHQRAVVGMEADRRLLGRTGASVEELDSGCCGMAGAFGFERRHYALSMARGEQVLLPAVRAITSDTTVLADGFSCREQIRQGTGRRATPLAEFLAAGLD